VAAGPPATEIRPAAIGYRRPGNTRLLPLLVVSIGLHIVAALGLAWVLSRHLKEPVEVVDLGIDVTLGEAVQELIVAQASPEPPASIPAPPPPPPPEPAPVEPPPEPPPVPMEKPEFVEPKPEPKPLPKPAPKRDQPPKATPAKAGGAPAGARVGPVPQAGVVGGVTKAEKTSGTPGGQSVGTWRLPKPSYPPAALVSRIQGSGEVRVTTDASGNVKEVTVTRPIAPILDANTRSFARANWKGPPNSTRTVPIIYRLE